MVIADLADNPGGGAPGDSTFALLALQDACVERAAFGCVWDPKWITGNERSKPVTTLSVR
ncbi:MAG: MlrC C-terminal domain-containing protein [Rhodobacterales bacterium]|uniref:MlrC C-terminal domain-containing protein n=1 Tax=Puniceibacterium antarcticum TaxID=1206336 RepID=UPI0015D4F2E8|nr:MlrC C-terminal domain-containing protein [Puniceibacterium antarcticum]